MAYLLPLALASPGFCPPAVVHCTDCALCSWSAAAMWRSCGTQGRFRWCVASFHVVVGCGTLFSVGDLARHRVAVWSCCAALDGVWSCGVPWLQRCVVSLRVLCRVVWRWVVSSCAGCWLCHVASCIVLWRLVVWCSVVSCCVVLCSFRWVMVVCVVSRCCVSLVFVACRRAACCGAVVLCGALSRAASCWDVSWWWYVVALGCGLW